MAKRLEGKAAVITGAASGIGAATARLFVEEGAQVVIADILDAEGEALARELGARARFQHTDTTQEADVQRVVDFAAQTFGRLDIMFNNAGASRRQPPIDEISMADYDKEIAVLQRGVFMGIKHAGRHMKRQGSGSILSTASVGGLQAGYASIVYSTAKAAVIHMTRCAAVELAESGVRVNCICPGGIATPIFARALGFSQSQAVKTVPFMEAGLKEMQPIHRAGKPEDIARAALWLASDDSSFVNGHALVVDGGLACGRSYSESQARTDQIMAALSSLAGAAD